MKKLISLTLAVLMVLALCACGSTAAPVADSGKTTYKVGICQLMEHESLDKATAGFAETLKAELEAVGAAVEIDTQVAGEANLCTTVINTFTAKKVDLIMANATPALLAAANATSDIPVLGTSVTDYADTFSGNIPANVSGTSDAVPFDEQARMMIDTLKLVPGDVVGVLYCTNESNSLIQYKGSANINDGRGAIVIGLAAIFIGLSVSLKIKPNFVCSLIGVVGGGIVYYVVYNFVILLGLKTDYLKMLSAVIVAIFLAVPYLKVKYLTKQKPLDCGALAAQTGGLPDA